MSGFATATTTAVTATNNNATAPGAAATGNWKDEVNRPPKDTRIQTEVRLLAFCPTYLI